MPQAESIAKVLDFFPELRRRSKKVDDFRRCQIQAIGQLGNLSLVRHHHVEQCRREGQKASIPPSDLESFRGGRLNDRRNLPPCDIDTYLVGNRFAEPFDRSFPILLPRSTFNRDHDKPGLGVPKPHCGLRLISLLSTRTARSIEILAGGTKQHFIGGRYPFIASQSFRSFLGSTRMEQIHSLRESGSIGDMDQEQFNSCSCGSDGSRT